jgi:hypothetical protein
MPNNVRPDFLRRVSLVLLLGSPRLPACAMPLWEDAQLELETQTGNRRPAQPAQPVPGLPATCRPSLFPIGHLPTSCSHLDAAALAHAVVTFTVTAAVLLFIIIVCY